MRNLLKTDWAAWIALLLPFIALLFVWDMIPEEVPQRWNEEGEVVAYGSKDFTIFIMPLASVFTYLLLLAVPYIDPKGKMAANQKGLRVFRFLIPLMFTAIFADICLRWLGILTGESIRLPLLLVLGFFALMGNYFSTFPPNYFVGIRTPWTLEDPENWRKTHRFAGRMWVSVSLLLIPLAFFLFESLFFMLFMAGTLLMAFVPILYSFLLFLEKKKATAEDA